ncbi:hypothetical protein B0H21DRAFT_825157 [Amylocystis lapponica]|nr:hypothetical protein B0H21DRAFT_825157 [Amylocystis lapponica]
MKVKRKRKRSQQAIDPCLGFYPSIPSSPSEFLGSIPPCEHEAHKNIPNVSQITQPAQTVAVHAKQSPDRNVLTAVTVEDFLRWSTEGPVKRYGKRARKRNQASPDKDYEQDSEDQESYPKPLRHRKRRRALRICASSEAEDIPVSSTGSEKRLKPRITRFSKRILTAAMRSHVDLTASSYHQDDMDVTHILVSRFPLTLVSDVEIRPTAMDSRQCRIIVDPKKALPMHDACFSAQGTVSPSVVPRVPVTRRPISQWNPVLLGPPARCIPSGTGENARNAPPEERNAVPFTLVSLEEHEASLHARNNTSS